MRFIFIIYIRGESKIEVLRITEVVDNNELVVDSSIADGLSHFCRCHTFEVMVLMGSRVQISEPGSLIIECDWDLLIGLGFRE